MLRIRTEQMKVFEQTAILNFESRMLEHIRKYFPEHFKALGEDNCRELTRFGIERGAMHDFVNERDICKFIDLMLCFGIEFDSGPDHPWAIDILSDNSWQRASDKMDSLFETGIEHLRM